MIDKPSHEKPADQRARVGIIGTGSIAKAMHIPVLRAMPAIEIAWIADADPARARAVASANGLRAVAIGDLPPCDVVLLAIPLPARPGYFDRFRPGETAVLAEKPFAIGAAEHRRVADAYTPWRLGCGYQRRFYASTLGLRDLVRSKLLGSLREIHLQEGGRVTRAGEEGYVDGPTSEGGGLVRNLGCHSLDLLLWIAQARNYRFVERRVEWDGATDRHASAAMQFLDLDGAAGSICDVSWSVSWLEEQRNAIRFVFDNGAASCPIVPSGELALQDLRGNALGALSVARNGGATTATQAFYLEWSDFSANVMRRAESAISALSCLKVAEMMDELIEGSRQT